jgi:hypothetical protein
LQSGRTNWLLPKIPDNFEAANDLVAGFALSLVEVLDSYPEAATQNEAFKDVRKRRKPFYANQNRFNLPVGSDRESLKCRAESRRAYCEKAIWLDKVVVLSHALERQDNGEHIYPVFDEFDMAIITLVVLSERLSH